MTDYRASLVARNDSSSRSTAAYSADASAACGSRPRPRAVIQRQVERTRHVVRTAAAPVARVRAVFVPVPVAVPCPGGRCPVPAKK
jgi:hypothetical protein